MKLIPNYSYEFNCILNGGLSEDEQIKNFASLLTDKDRFLSILPILEKNLPKIEGVLGYKLVEKFDFFVVRAEKFKSFSLPITIEYSIYPEEMLLYLLKEIIKVSITDRFPDDYLRDKYINSFIDYLVLNLDWDNLLLTGYAQNIHDLDSKKYDNYEILTEDFSKSKMVNFIEKLFEEEIYGK